MLASSTACTPFVKLCICVPMQSAVFFVYLSAWRDFSGTLMEATKTTLSTVAHLRNQFLQENNIQFVLDKCHRYGWADTYIFTKNGEQAGYGSVWGKDKREDRDAIFEFYLIESVRNVSNQFFALFCRASNASYIECQSNDRFLYPMFEKFAINTYAEAILFADDHETNLLVDKSSIERKDHANPDDCQYVINYDSKVAGTGGFMLNYNVPYADIYYEIHEDYRRKGLGSFFVQELKKEIYKMGRVPAARCNVTNAISKATLLKAGFIVCGLRVNGDIHVTID
jgi:RimJ/RimL family protein N-acetyltransferase